MTQPKIGLVLGSGAARGWAHIGIIEALEKHGVEISMLSGTSAGSFIAASYAGGGLASIKKFAMEMDWKRVLTYMDIAFPRSGFIDGRKVAELIQSTTQATQFKDLSIPVNMLATDMFSGEQVILSEGRLTEAVIEFSEKPLCSQLALTTSYSLHRQPSP